ncbi:MAG: ATP synthase F1 subunit delta [Planctomycetota bacterium]
MTSITGLRYVKPLFELAQEGNALDEVGNGIKEFSRLLKEAPELESALLNPQIPAQKKIKIILALTERDFPPLLRNFFCLLVDKGRTQVFLHLEREFNKLLMESRNIISATVQTPVPLDEDYRNDLTRRFEALTGKSVELNEEVKPELIAGVRIMLGSNMIDGSLKARLNNLKRHLRQSSAGKAG